MPKKRLFPVFQSSSNHSCDDQGKSPLNNGVSPAGEEDKASGKEKKKQLFLLFAIIFIGIITFLFVEYTLLSTIIFFYLFVPYLVIFNSKTGIMLLALSFPFVRNSYEAITGEFYPILFYLVFLIAVIALFYGNLIGNKIMVHFLLIKKLLILFTLYLFFSLAVVTNDPTYGLEKMMYYLMNVILFLLPVCLIKKKSDLIDVIKAVLYMGIFLTIFSALSYFDMEPFFRDSIAGRFSTLDINPIWMARFLTYAVLCEMFFIGLLSREFTKHIGKILLLTALIIVQLYFAFLTASRGPVLAAMISVIVVVLIHVRFRISHMLIFVGVLALLFFLILSFVPFDIADRLLFSDHGGQATSLIRVMLNVEALTMFWENKVIGTGIGSFDFISFRYPHNIFTESLAEFGLIGFSLLMLLLLTSLNYLVKLSRKVNKTHFYLLLALFTAAIINANLSGHIGSNFYLFFTLGLISAAYSATIAKKGSPKTDESSKALQ